jgi:hypothetical protein
MFSSTPRAKIYAYHTPSNTAKDIAKTALYRNNSHYDQKVLIGSRLSNSNWCLTKQIF